MARNETLAQNIESEYAERRSLGETMSDHLASFGGSWSFLIAFAGFLAVWMAINIGLGADRAFDNYPFILLNLVLSTIAAIQAPIIMMSQKRQAGAAVVQRPSQSQGRTQIGQLQKIDT
jgi:uncharacterized membrane protein